MAEITKINSGKAIVKLSREELVENNLDRWLRSDSLGQGHRFFTQVQPFEKVAAHYYNEKYPSETVKIGERFFLNNDGSVDVVLRVSEYKAEGYYNTHPVKLTFEGFQSKQRMASVGAVRDNKIGNLEMHETLSIPDIDFMVEHIAELSKDELDLLDEYLHREKSAVEILADIEEELLNEKKKITSINNLNRTKSSVAGSDSLSNLPDDAPLSYVDTNTGEVHSDAKKATDPATGEPILINEEQGTATRVTDDTIIPVSDNK